ncbi:MAG TPA: DUF47 domain-containing protein, partial [Armatimonadota bacterium]|nr:DUF47 domain-containing protein [Armatimonadota bacterium]
MAKTGMLDKIFPARYDFYKMLGNQAQSNSGAVNALVDWLGSAAQSDAERLDDYAGKADAIRKELEKQLVEAFSTPFDRGDLYSISVTMHRCLEYARSTLVSMQAFEVAPDGIVHSMAAKLKFGAETFASSVVALRSAPGKAELLIPP